jgi:hypothetical protein
VYQKLKKLRTSLVAKERNVPRYDERLERICWIGQTKVTIKQDKG